MKEMPTRYARGLLLAVATLLLLLAAYWVTSALGWPLWVGIFLTLLLTGGVLGAVLIRRLWLHCREQRLLVEVNRERAPLSGGTAEREKDGAAALRALWKKALLTLRDSHLKKQGNPLYVLPWYLMLGASGSGKTSALQGAGLPSALGGKGGLASVCATEHCDWWFFEEAIFLDSAGRYAVPLDEARDAGEWRTLVRLLAKHRKREPLNGLLVTIAVDQLLAADQETLAADGRTIRLRIDELMKGLGVRFPVYVLVTKCDLLSGLASYQSLLPGHCLAQPLGALNRELSAEPADFLDGVYAEVISNLRELRLRLLLEPQGRESQAGLLLFPEELASLKDALRSFLQGAFGCSRYQETPLLRGLFFSCGRQASPSCSRLSDPLPPTALPGSHQKRERGLFLHDLFSKVLPLERWLAAPTRRASQWRSVTGNLGLLCWLILGTALCGLLSFSFARNLTAIRQISQLYARPCELSRNLLSDLTILDRHRQGILAVEEQNRHWWFPRLGLEESLTVEQELKSRFCRQFHDGLLISLDKSIEAQTTQLTQAAPDELYVQYLVHLARRINLLKARQRGESLEALRGMPEPGYLPLTVGSFPAAGSEVQQRFGSLYLSYLCWRTDGGELTREIVQGQRWLKALLALKGGSLQWAVSWVERQGGAPAVTLAEFWGGNGKAAGEQRVPAAFTRKGSEKVESLLREIEAALPEPPFTDAQLAEFQRWHRSATLASWESFTAAFPAGAGLLKGEREWQQMAARIAADQGPYFALVKRLAWEFGASVGEGELPSWLRQVHELQLAMAGAVGRENGKVERAADGGKKLLVSLEKKIGREASAQELDKRLSASSAYRDYRSALSALAPAALSSAQAFQAASQLYGEDQAVGKSPFLAAFAAAQRLKAPLVSGNSPDGVVARLIDGPLDFLGNFLRKETAVSLQRQWEEQVLAGTLGLTPQQAAPLLLGPDGLAWKFVKGPAAPFLTRTLRGYRAKEVQGGSIQFAGGFFTFLERGSQLQAAALTRQANYSVGVEGLPTDSNPEARVRPHATRLELQCGSSAQSLTNLNYPVGKTYNWSPDQCGDVTLQIEVGELTLSQRWAGPQAFPEFLHSFATGQRTFSPGSFPGERSALERMGIRYLRVNYKLTGSAPVIKQGNLVSGMVPREIARGWNF